MGHEGFIVVALPALPDGHVVLFGLPRWASCKWPIEDVVGIDQRKLKIGGSQLCSRTGSSNPAHSGDASVKF
jgi:hypothetical protein